jgi:sigma-E factor negative regulatory protein RseB
MMAGRRLPDLIERGAGYIYLLVLLAGFPALATAASGDNASAWLEKMERALKEESYDGIFTYMRGYHFDTIKVVHEFKDNKEIERLVSLNGPQREIIRNGDKVVFRRPKSDNSAIDQVMPLGPFTHAFNQNLATYQSFYDFAVLGDDRVAGRPAVKLSITPRNHDRYGYRLWLDKKTGLLLQSHLVNRGHILEVFQFSRVDIGQAIDPADFTSTLSDAVEYQLAPMNPHNPKVASIKPDWRAAWLPSGFKLVSSETPDRLLYSDGIATFSVFVDRGNSSRLGELTTHMGGTVVITRKLKGSAQQITVVGEVPVDTAKRVADSVEPVLY